MNRINQILFHAQYQNALEQIGIWEREREFCRHTIEHFLDVARLAYIRSLEKGLDVKKDVIYAAALLHDIGRYQQYENGTPHEVASARLAEGILQDCAYSEEERAQIEQAILGHRSSHGGENADVLGKLLYWADKASRNCFACDAREACHWPDEKMNMEIQD